MPESTLNAKGRILIPEKIRKKAHLSTGSKVKVQADDGIVKISKSVSVADFIRRTEGALKEGSPVKITDPLRLKEFWRKS